MTHTEVQMFDQRCKQLTRLNYKQQKVTLIIIIIIIFLRFKKQYLTVIVLLLFFKMIHQDEYQVINCKNKETHKLQVFYLYLSN